MKKACALFCICVEVAVASLLSCRGAAQNAKTPAPSGLQLAQPPGSANAADGAVLAAPALAADPNVAATVVVFNSADEESGLLAKFYAEKRGIPAEQVVGIPCSVQEEITRTEYEEGIAEPLRKIFTEQGWWKLRPPEDAAGPVASNRVRFLALMRGVPLKISAGPWKEDKPSGPSPIGTRNEAAVDSELATLGLRTRVVSGALGNPYFKSMTAFRDVPRPDVMLVCRLDGPSAAVVRRMIVDGLATEKTGLRGFSYLDARGIAEAGLKEGDEWLYAAAGDLRKNGYPVILDNGPAMFPEQYPMRYAALYFGWYSEQLAGPFARPGFRFVPGAVAVHIHSFSALTVRSDRLYWAGPLLNLGAAATLGNVYEPYLGLTPQLDIFEERLRLGFTFAEAAYASQRVLSWMGTCVGDPLYRPFPQLLDQTPSKSNAEWEAYRKGALVWLKDAGDGRKVLQQSGRTMNSGIIFESLALLEMGGPQRNAAVEDLTQAMKLYTNVEDILRVAIHLCIQYRGAGRENDAVALCRKLAKQYPAAPGLAVLRLIVPSAFQ